MLYTRKGDTGTTKTYGCDQRMSKSSAVAEALGSLDEINSFLGLVKVKSDAETAAMLHSIQENLFIIQAEVAGFPKSLPAGRVEELEKIIDEIEKKMPPIKTFFISGGTENAALFDISRTIARRAERRVVAVAEEKMVNVSKETLAFLNRLSSILYALARFSNHKGGIIEQSPNYK